MLQRDEGEGWSGYITEASEAEYELPSAAHTADDIHVRGLGCLSIGARGVPDQRSSTAECTEPPVSTLLLSAVHPVQPPPHLGSLRVKPVLSTRALSRVRRAVCHTR